MSLKFIKTIRYSLLLVLILFILTTNVGSIYQAKTLTILEPMQNSNLNIYEKELAYSFKIADKLIGNGVIKLSIENNKLQGTAKGFGMTSACNADVNLYTNINGILADSDGDISVSVEGEGVPLRSPLPGKISYHGPLKGFLQNEKLSLTGKVHIKGFLASYAGFKKIEDLLIEIENPFPGLTLSEIRKQCLASL